jgi:hypothetical protein
MMLGYLRKLIRENRSLRRQNADLAGMLAETSHALNRAVRRNLDLCDSLQESTQTIRDLMR